MKLNMKRKKIVVIGLSLALIIFLTIGVVSYWNTKRHIESMVNVEKALWLLYELQNLMSLLKDAETGERGFVITGNWTFLEPYYDGITAVHQSMKRLKKLTPIDDHAYQKLDSIQGMIDKRFAQFHETITLRKTRGIEAAKKLIMTARGKKVMGDIRNLVGELKNEKTDLLQRLNRISEERSHRTLLTIVIGNLVAFLFVFFSFFQLYRKTAERNRVEEVLMESEERYRTLVANLPVAVYRNTPGTEGKFLMGNPAFCKMFGFKNEEEVKKVAPADIYANPKEIKQFSDTLIEKGVIENDERTLLKKDGTPIYTSITAGVVYGKDGEISHFDCIMLDITEQKLAKDALWESEEKYKLLVENQSDMIVKFDTDGQLTFVSQSYCKTFGKSEDELLGKNFIPRIHEEDRKAVVKALDKVHRPPYTAHVEERAMTKDGWRWQAWLNTAVLNEEKEVKSTVAVGRDINKQKQAEEALRESEEKYRRLMENALIGIYQVEKGGKFIMANRKMAEMFGYDSPESLISSADSIVDLYARHEERRTILNEINTKGFIRGKEVEFRRKDGNTFWIKLHTRVVTIGEKSVYEGVMEDITESKQAEEERITLQDKLQRAQKMEAMGLMAGGVAHDLNNILSGVVSLPELLLMNLPKDSPIRKPIKTIQESGMRAADVVEDLMTIARGVASSKEPLDLNTTVEEYLKSAEHLKLERTHLFVSFKTELDPTLLNMSGSHTHIKKILMNLVSNASEAIEGSGTVTISTVNQYLDMPLKGYEDVRTGEYTMLAVSDDGTGISPDDLERIF